MCKLLNISSSSLYYAKNKPAKKYNAEEEKLTQHIKEIFKNSRNNYGSRKIKVELKKKGIIASKRRIRRIMKENGFVSTYTVKQYRGTDHTREQVPLIIYSKQFNEMKVLNDGDSFGIIGSTICDNFNVKYNGIGSSILELLK